MIPVDSLLYKIDQKLNKLSTNEHQQIQLEDKILALNEAQIKLIKQKVDGFSTIPGLGEDAFKKRYEDLQSLVVAYNDGKLPLTLKNAELNQWAANIHLLVPKYMFYVDSYFITNSIKSNPITMLDWLFASFANSSANCQYENGSFSSSRIKCLKGSTHPAYELHAI